MTKKFSFCDIVCLSVLLAQLKVLSYAAAALWFWRGQC